VSKKEQIKQLLDDTSMVFFVSLSKVPPLRLELPWLYYRPWGFTTVQQGDHVWICNFIFALYDTVLAKKLLRGDYIEPLYKSDWCLENLPFAMRTSAGSKEIFASSELTKEERNVLGI
jgi:hypothetical protein